MSKFQDILGRIVATFLSSALAIVGGSSVLNAFTKQDISILQSAGLAGLAACAQVIERLARASLDGNLTKRGAAVLQITQFIKTNVSFNCFDCFTDIGGRLASHLATSRKHSNGFNE